LTSAFAEKQDAAKQLIGLVKQEDLIQEILNLTIFEEDS